MKGEIRKEIFEKGENDLVKAFGIERKVVEGTNKKKKRPFHILVVDDEPLILFIAAKALNQPGVSVDVAENGLQAQKRILVGNYDLVITDINMPEMNGVDLLRWVKKSRPQIEGIVMTGHGISEAMTDELLGTVTDYLTKPFPLVMLQEAVKRSIERLESRNEKKGEKKV
jgi:DNA-binding NtrC family response regulator